MIYLLSKTIVYDSGIIKTSVLKEPIAFPDIENLERYRRALVFKCRAKHVDFTYEER